MLLEAITAISWMDWASMLLRWLHIITAVAWIGSSFYFIWLDLSLRKRPDLPEGAHGESWSVHGGGFYEVRKYLVAPSQMPEELHWFKYESYFTWLSGFFLLSVIYYWGAESFLIAPDRWLETPNMAILASLAYLAGGWLAYDILCRSPVGKKTGPLAVGLFILILVLAWALMNSFQSRAAFLHVGAVIATIMTANVFFIIIPNQKKVVAALKAGQPVDPALGAQAKQRSTHNNYLTLPVILMMISGHYPILIQPEKGVVIIGLILLAGGVIRDYFNSQHAGRTGFRVRWQWPSAVVLIFALMLVTSYREAIEAGAGLLSDNEAHALVKTHCANCHSASPSLDGFDVAPGGVMFDDIAQVKADAKRILDQAVYSDAMPLGNMTEMTDEERQALGAYLLALPE